MQLRGLSGMVAATALVGCVVTAPDARLASPAGTPLAVLNNGQPFLMSDGALARKAADAECGPRGVKVSIYDRYDRSSGEWVYPGGCA